ncbi:J domain-containing protein [Ruegeria atlantica]|uniref:J domain-containing protein n=1 Tax=Ruegeria atlantica TaxID=81569 RepID=UPI00147A9557|nr:J domain-containing protein [Ruegeria atlantica]
MQTAEKIKARTEALYALGLDQNASSDDIRSAWRNIAFHGHPDQAQGDSSGFTRAKDAYDFLRKEGLAGKGAGSGKPRRPKLRRRILALESSDINACRALLNTALPNRSDEVEVPESELLCKSDHVPDAVGFFGRHLTFFVSTPVFEGANRVALPTSVLASSRQTETEVLNFQSNDSGGGEVVVPDAITARTFPGAKSVRIRFDADQQMRDEFQLAH